MNAHTNVTIVKDSTGNPAFAVIPYDDSLALTTPKEATVPSEVVNMVFDQHWTPIKAWREYLKYSQADIASKLHISQAAYSKQESSTTLRTTTKQKIADALGIALAQLDF